VVEKLEAEATQQPSSPVAVDAAVETPALQQPLASPPVETPTAAPVAEAEAPASQTQVPVSATPTFVDRFLPSFDRVQRWWIAALQKIRALLPASLNQKLSDWNLTAAGAVIVVVLLWTTVALLPGKPPDWAHIPAAEINTPPELKAPTTPEPVPIAPSPVASTPVPIAPSPVASTPEQNLIASIQDRVAQITNQYANGLIQSIEANFEASLLIVKVDEAWYNLSPSQQDKLADEMLRRSQELDFSKLQISDRSNTLLARSPVVGTHMVIFKRI
jgi:hypothetical protein